MAKEKKKERRLNPQKKATKDEKKKVASDGRSKARESLRLRREKIAQNQAKKEKLEKELENAKEEEAKRLKAEIDTIMSELQDDEKAEQDAKAEEAKFKQDEDDADNEDEYSDMDVDDSRQGNGENKRDQPEVSIEGNEEKPDFLEKLMKGLHLGDPHFDLRQDAQLRNTQAVLCYKNGFGKPAIVVDYEFPDFHIYRIRNDVLIPESTPNLMKWRRAGKVNPKTGKKWCVEDMVEVFPRIAIKVPPGYVGNPENLVKLIPAISGADRDALKKEGKPAPKQPDVQMYIEWKDGFVAEGETEERFSSWESRSGCRTLWKKQVIADNFLVTVATKREEAYRNAGGKNSSEQRSMSPFEFPRAGSSPDREYSETPEGEEGGKEEEEKEKRKKEEEEKRKKEEEEKKKKEKDAEKDGDKTAAQKREEEKKKEKDEKDAEKNGEKSAAQKREEKKAARAEYKLDWCDEKNIDSEKELSDQQMGSFMASFKTFWDESNKV